MLLTTPGLAVAQPGSQDTLGALVAAVANANQKLQELGAAIQAQQESVNKAIVDVQTARDNAAAAQQEVDASAQRVTDSLLKIASQKFATVVIVTHSEELARLAALHISMLDGKTTTQNSG